MDVSAWTTAANSGSDLDAFRCAVGYAVRAPSSHNTQPWRFRIRADAIELRRDTSRQLAVVDPDGRELVMSCGAALFQLRCALRQLGYDAVIDARPNPDDPAHLARVTCARGAQPDTEAQSLFSAFSRRRTHRGPFLPRALPAGLHRALHTAALAEDAFLVAMDEADARAAITALVAQGDREQGRDPRFRRELAGWLRPNSSRRGDGLMGYSLGLGDLRSQLAPWIVGRFDLGSQLARSDEQLMREAPAVVVLATTRDDEPSWLAAGQALAHVLLTAAAQGVSAGFMNQPMQLPTLRERAHTLLARPGFAQLVLRFGCAWSGRPSRRRPLHEVID